MKLYIAHVGFYDDELGMYEIHSNMLVAAKDITSAKKAVIENQLFVKKKMHIDAIQEVINVDGYSIQLNENGEKSQNKVFKYEDLKMLAS